jgi:trehalose synthase
MSPSQFDLLRRRRGRTVAEAMWKVAAVIGGNTGGFRHQIQGGENGFLFSSVAEAAHRIVQLLKDKKLRQRLGARAREAVRKQFLLGRLLEQYLDLFDSFMTVYRLK